MHTNTDLILRVDVGPRCDELFEYSRRVEACSKMEWRAAVLVRLNGYVHQLAKHYYSKYDTTKDYATLYAYNLRYAITERVIRTNIIDCLHTRMPIEQRCGGVDRIVLGGVV